VTLFDQTASAYQKLLQGPLSAQEIPLREGWNIVTAVVDVATAATVVPQVK
jgi:hypothetical protein